MDDAAIQQHQLQRAQTDRNVEKRVVLARRAAIIADHNHLGEILLLGTRHPMRVGKQTLVFFELGRHMQRIGRPQ